MNTVLRYKDYRDSPWADTPYELSRTFWNILAARLAFVIIFQVTENGSTWLVSKKIPITCFYSWFLNSLSLQNVVMLMSDFVDWLIPDIPKDISLQIHKDKNLIVELFMKEELGKRHMGKRKSNPSPQSRSRTPSQVQINNR